MKRKIAFLLLFAALALVLASCGTDKDLTLDQFFESGTAQSQTATLKSAAAVTGLDSYVYEESSNGFALFHDATAKKYAVYDFVTGATVLTFNDETTAEPAVSAQYGIRGYTVGALRLFLLETAKESAAGTTYAGKLCKANGGELTSAQTRTPAGEGVENGRDFLFFNHKIFRANGTEIAQAACFALPEGYDEMERYGQYYVESLGNGDYALYDLSFNLYDLYGTPAGAAAMSNSFVLADGSILTQTFEFLPADTEKYDLYVEGEKAKMKTYLYNAAEKSETEITLAYVLQDVEPIRESERAGAKAEMGIVYSEKVQNFAWGESVADKAFGRSALLVLDNGGKVLYANETLHDAQIVVPFTATTFYVRDSRNNAYLLDKDGKPLKKIDFERTSPSYLMHDGALFNKEDTLLYAYAENGYTFVKNYGDRFFFEKGGKYYAFNGTSMSAMTLAEGESLSFGSRFYTVTGGANTRYYNGAGTEVYRTAKTLSEVASASGATLYRYTDGEAVKYVAFRYE